MGCDFYVYVYLEIEHKNGKSYYEFPSIRGYYCDLECWRYDSDDDNNANYNSPEYKLLYNNMKKLCLTTRAPVVIYSDNSFTSQTFELKYLPMIQNIINKTYVNKYLRYLDTGVFTDIEQIIKITKKEDRHDPYSDYDSGSESDD